MKRNSFFEKLIEIATSPEYKRDTVVRFDKHAKIVTNSEEYDYFVTTGAVYKKDGKELYSANLGLL